MIETDIRRVCTSLALPHVYTLRSLLMHFYQRQMSNDATKVFDAFFKFGRDAKWCQRQVQCNCQYVVDHILWPPLTTKPATTILVVNIRNMVFIPLSHPFMDQRTLRQFLELYDVA
jgi:hypothetical protein